VEGIAKITREPAKELLELELLRLDQLQSRLYADAINGDLRALESCLRIMDQRARLLGLYQTKPPATVNISLPTMYLTMPEGWEGELPSRVQ
jgi:hypothetical protein